jgi:hypothetical protein
LALVSKEMMNAWIVCVALVVQKTPKTLAEQEFQLNPSKSLSHLVCFIEKAPTKK